MTRRLVVWFEDRTVGTFEQSEDGRQAFVYADAWLVDQQGFAISLSMPLRAEPIDDRTTRAFFGGLLPDDELRRRLARYLQVSDRNEFALLAEVGRECAGAISLLPPGEQPHEATDDVCVLDDDAFADLLTQLPTRPLLVSDDVRLSLAGAQDKVAVRLLDKGIALPTDGGLTTHIVKVPIANYDDTVANECFCMQLAADIGLPAPSTEMRTVGDTEILLVKRFDREHNAQGKLRRLHQEDFCQAMAIAPDLKYQSEGGPGFVQLFELLTKHSSRAALDRLQLLDMAQFHFLIGNNDAHGKNYSLLHTQRGTRLAPIYDAMCTTIYPGLSPRMAMKVGSKRELDEVHLEHWTTLAQQTGFSPPFVVSRLRKLAEALPGHARSLQKRPPFVSNATIETLIASIEHRSSRMLGG